MAKKKVKKKTTKKATKKKVVKKASKKKTKKKATKKKVAKKASKKKTKKKATKKKVAKKASKKKTTASPKRKSSSQNSNNDSKKLKIPLDYSINNNMGEVSEEGSDESSNRAHWLGTLKNKNQELLNILMEWSDAYEREDIGQDSWTVKESSENGQGSASHSLKLFKPEQISEFIESQIIKWIKEPSDPNRAYNYTLEDFQKVFEKICHINSENTTPMGFSSDVRHLSRFLEIVDSNIKAMLAKHS